MCLKHPLFKWVDFVKKLIFVKVSDSMFMGIIATLGITYYLGFEKDLTLFKVLTIIVICFVGCIERF